MIDFLPLCNVAGPIGCNWFPFTLWTGARWRPARMCKHWRCSIEQWHNGTRWISANLRHVREAVA